MWPSKLPAQLRHDRYRQAEIRVFDLLATQLDSKWTVFYSRPWLGLTPTGGERDGECDFVIIHPDLGFLAVEVKGGAISFDPTEDRWISRDRDGIRHTIKNPVDQARRSKHELLRRAKELPTWPNNAFVRARHGVIFPDAEAPAKALGPDRPAEIFCGRIGLPTLGRWVHDRLSGGEHDPLGAGGVRAFNQLLAAPFTLKVPLAHVLEDDDIAIGVLTPQQFHILDAITHIPRVAVGGGAGTGKTIVAMEDAARLAEKGMKVLLTCLSRDLATHIAGRLAATTVVVLDFASLCRFAAKQAALGGDVPPADLWGDLLLNASAKSPTLRFDAIVVDEAQDIKSHWWIGVEALLADTRSSKLHAFYDTNQRLYGVWTSQLADFRLIPIQLTRNLRNTQSIHASASRFYSGLPITADGPEGVPVEWIDCHLGEEVEKAVKRVRHLARNESISPIDMAVLAPSSTVVSRLRSALAGEIRAGTIVQEVTQFKGLESRTVVLVASKELLDEPELAYVALSRARTLLVVIGTTPVLNWLRGAIA